MQPGPWNTGLGVPSDINMASYTPEQWAMLQQQNWQQWTQWQQQYAQWQNQCGEKYLGQIQAMQSMGGVPPLPPSNAATLPAPPPPDKPPPPPPPHENNQPLYGSVPTKLAPVPPPQHKPGTYNYTIPTAGNNINSSSTAVISQDVTSSVNADALKKLAEEERLFDIQFQKWEEEIDKWRRENINHPDKQAYKEYEQKFEACRAQLLERRQQMKQKKSKPFGIWKYKHCKIPKQSSTSSTNSCSTTTTKHKS